MAITNSVFQTLIYPGKIWFVNDVKEFLSREDTKYFHTVEYDQIIEITYTEFAYKKLCGVLEIYET